MLVIRRNSDLAALAVHHVTGPADGGEEHAAIAEIGLLEHLRLQIALQLLDELLFVGGRLT